MHKNNLSWSLFFIWVRNYLFLKNYVTSEGAVSHNVLCYQQLSIAWYQIRCYANHRFWVMVTSAFKLKTIGFLYTAQIRSINQSTL